MHATSALHRADRAFRSDLDVQQHQSRLRWPCAVGRRRQTVRDARRRAHPLPARHGRVMLQLQHLRPRRQFRLGSSTDLCRRRHRRTRPDLHAVPPDGRVRRRNPIHDSGHVEVRALSVGREGLVRQHATVQKRARLCPCPGSRCSDRRVHRTDLVRPQVRRGHERSPHGDLHRLPHLAAAGPGSRLRRHRLDQQRPRGRGLHDSCRRNGQRLHRARAPDRGRRRRRRRARW